MTLLVADIGGTRARFALYDQGHAVILSEFPTAELDGASAATVVARALEVLGIRDVAAICFAVAGPVIDGRASMTNVNLSFDELEISTASAGLRLVLNFLTSELAKVIDFGFDGRVTGLKFLLALAAFF